MGKKRRFIDKKKAIRFRLAVRSQKDPLIASTAPENVLVPESSSWKKEKELTKEERLAEQAKYGIYFEDDDYDYLQHLKDANELEPVSIFEEHYRIFSTGQVVEAGKTVVVPSTLLGSQGVQLKVGLLNQAAPQSGPHPELDPDIVAALDDDGFDFTNPENCLEDDFVIKANAPLETSERGTAENRYLEQNFSMDEDVQLFDDRRSRFSGISSLTSSTMRRSEGLQLLDQRFEKVEFCQEYNFVPSSFLPGKATRVQCILFKVLEEYEDDLNNEDCFGAAAGTLEPKSDRLRLLVKEYNTDDVKYKEDEIEDDSERLDFKNKTLLLASTEPVFEKVEIKPTKAAFDCESVISLNSSFYNQPTVIDVPVRKRKLSKSSCLPLESVEFPNRRNSESSTACSECSQPYSYLVASNVRQKNETPEERRLRKKLFKQECRERRMRKKELKIVFKTEELRAKLLEANTLRNLKQIKLQ
ncbi:protein LTV1 [Trichuris trichiura]|uniref:Protein LTV1 homolog n=1 Tax=Trichuris trichiura TaxID=36087 RepID=A0A077ZM33_TRITR|nr:protein LTV1 [Trichuris trichiura]